LGTGLLPSLVPYTFLDLTISLTASLLRTYFIFPLSQTIMPQTSAFELALGTYASDALGPHQPITLWCWDLETTYASDFFALEFK